MRTVFIFLFFSSFSFAQEFQKNEAGEIEYAEVVELPELSADQMQKKCKKWFSEAYQSAQDVIQSESTENITGKGAASLLLQHGIIANMRYTIIVDFKPGKYRVMIRNIEFGSGGNWGTAEVIDQGYQEAKGKKKNSLMNIWISYINFANQHCEGIIASLKKAMLKKDDW